MPGHTVSGFERRSFLGKVAAGHTRTGAVTIGRGVSAVSAWDGRPDKTPRSTSSTGFQPAQGSSESRPISMQLAPRPSLTEQRNTHYVPVPDRHGRRESRGGATGPVFGNVAAYLHRTIERAAQYLVGQSAWDIESIWQEHLGSAEARAMALRSNPCIAAIGLARCGTIVRPEAECSSVQAFGRKAS